MTFSAKKLRAMASGTGPDALRATLLLWKFEKPEYGRWADLVETCIAFEAGQISRRRPDFQKLGEDGLTAVLLIGLNSLGLRSSSSYVSGNCDVTIDYEDEYLWLGEAKIFTGAQHVWHGYLQLRDRYANGLQGENRAGMILYCLKDEAKVLLEEWRASLREQLVAANDRDGAEPLSFRSSDACRSSGLPLELVHMAFALRQDPTEGKVKLTKAALAKGQKAKKSARDAAP